MNERSKPTTSKLEKIAWQEAGDGRYSRVQTVESSPQSKRGNLYIIAEISQPSQDGGDFLDSFMFSLIKGFKSASHSSLEEAFDDVVLRANLFLQNANKVNNTSSWLGGFHVVLGIQRKERFIFSTLGEPRVLLHRGSKVNDITHIKRKDDVASAISFTNINLGILETNDSLLITTPGLLEIFPLDHLELLL